MAQTLPMLEHDPRDAYKVSRGLRVGIFSIVVSMVLVAILIVVVRFIWDEFAAPAFNMAPYDSNPFFVVPAMFVIAAFLAKMLWDTAEGKQPVRRK